MVLKQEGTSGVPLNRLIEVDTMELFSQHARVSSDMLKFQERLASVL